MLRFPESLLPVFQNLTAALASTAMFLTQFKVIFQIIDSMLHSSESLFQFVLVEDRRFGPLLQRIYVTALLISISDFQSL